jgi:2-methylisocitrate lyase-like PEP mutase family enzyme
MALATGARLRRAVEDRDILPFIGIYDVFSASLAARTNDSLFLSGFGFAASHYGLPDVGFVTWSDMVELLRRLRDVLPHHHLLVDIDDGYGGPEQAAYVAVSLQSLGASGIVLEDQRRPKRCGHLGGKQILPVGEYLEKLDAVLQARRDLFVIARTDAEQPDEMIRRTVAYGEAGADAVLVDGIVDLSILPEIAASVNRPLVFNQISGGKSPACSLDDLSQRGVSIVLYSTPCLFAAQRAIQVELEALNESGGRLEPPGADGIGLTECNEVLEGNLARRQAEQERVPSAVLREARIV